MGRSRLARLLGAVTMGLLCIGCNKQVDKYLETPEPKQEMTAVDYAIKLNDIGTWVLPGIAWVSMDLDGDGDIDQAVVTEEKTYVFENVRTGRYQTWAYPTIKGL